MALPRRMSAVRPGESYDDWFRRTSPGAASGVDAANRLAALPPTETPNLGGLKSQVQVTPFEPTAGQKMGARAQLFGAGAKRVGNQALNIGAKVGNELLPYASNIVNSFRRAPRGEYAGPVSAIAGRTFRMDATRAAAREGYRSQTTSAYRNLDENTAAAVSGGANSQYLRALGQVGEQEANLNAQAGLQVDQINQRNSQFNQQTLQEQMDNDVNRRSVNQTMQSTNLSNAADKRVTQLNNEQDRLAVLDSLKIYNLNDSAGVKARLAALARKAGISPDDLDAIDTTNKKRFGGPLTRGPRRRMSS